MHVYVRWCGELLLVSIDRSWRNALAEYEMGVEGKARGVDALSAVLGRQDAANNRRIIAGICQLVIGTG